MVSSIRENFTKVLHTVLAKRAGLMAHTIEDSTLMAKRRGEASCLTQHKNITKEIF
jgi:hypothetical protein